MRYFLVILTLLLSSKVVYSQEQESVELKLEQIIAPNLDATAVFKTNNTSANLSNGLLDVKVPLYTIGLKELNLDVELRYNSRGIMVADIASDVGLGWSLNYGGMVSRQVRDKADDGSSLGYLNHTYYKDMLNEYEFKVGKLFEGFNLHRDALDLIPDRFFFSIGSISGEFIFDPKTGKILQQNMSDIKIKAQFNERKIVGWEIIDTKGNKYYFGVLTSNDSAKASYRTVKNFIGFNPMIRYKDLGSPIEDYYDTWYLLKVETYHKEVVNYHYAFERSKYTVRNYDKKQHNREIGTQFETSYSTIIENKLYLNKIEFPSGRIELTKKGENRKDVNGSAAYHSVKLYSTSNALRSGYEFNFNTIVNNNTSDTYQLLSQLDESAKYRMFLQGIKLIDNTGSYTTNYTFDYDNMPLPNRFSTSKDMWGYYNGGNNGTVWNLWETQNVTVRSTTAGAGLLKSITYPTGKKEVFEYEDNYVVNSFHNKINPMAITTIRKYTNLGLPPLASYKDRNNCENIFADCMDLVGKQKRTITIPLEARNLRYSLTYNGFKHADDPNPNAPCIGEVYFTYEGQNYDIYQNQVVGAIAPVYTTPGAAHTGLIFLEEEKTYEVWLSRPRCGGGLEPGPSRFSSVNFGISWEVSVLNSNTEEIQAGGKRIKSITTLSDGATQMVREFKYEDEEGKNSGILLSPPPYVQKLKEVRGITTVTPFSLEESSPLSSFRYNGLAYSNVIEIKKGPANAPWGKINYAFTAPEDGGGGYYEWPFYLSINREWQRGLPLSTKYYKSNGENYVLEKEENNTYTFRASGPSPVDLYVKNNVIPAPGTILPPFVTADFYKSNRDLYLIPLIRFYRNQYEGAIDSRFLLIGGGEQMYYKRYFLSGGRYTLDKQEIIDYEGNATITKTITNSHASTKHYFQTSQTTTDALGDVSVVDYTYVQDVTGNAELNKLVAANRISVLDKIEVSKNRQKIQQQLYKYKNWGNNWVELEQVEESKGNDNYYANQKILFRDSSNGNIIEVEQFGTKTVYLYGYNRQLLIAKIENATKEQVANALGVTVANLVTINETKFTQLNNLRSNTALKDALITSYEHEPLVGITKITDVKGKKNTYAYDASGRLKSIKDDSGNILEEYEYNFKN